MTLAPRTDEPSLLVRGRLLAWLDEATAGPITVVTAPAGYGKTVLMHQWTSSHIGPLVSVRLEGDDDRDRFWRRLVTALGGLGPTPARALSRKVGDPATLGAEGLARVAREWRARGGLVLVVDAIDAPSDATLAGDLRALVSAPPAGLRLLLVRRSRRPAALDRVLQRVAPSIDEADLVFTPAEARQLVVQVAGLELGSTQLEALMLRTRGWAAALELAAIELRSASDPDDAIECLSGVDPYIAAYLRSEVLADLPLPARRFLERTSVVEHLTGPLCDAMTGGNDGAVVLRQLGDRGLFPRSVESADESVACHPLLRELLRHDLGEGRGASDEFLRRAAAWYVEQEHVEPAADCLVEAQDWGGVLALVDRSGRALFERGAARSAQRWLAAVPLGDPDLRTQVLLRQAYAEFIVGRSQRSEQLVHDLGPGSLSPGERVVVDALGAAWAFSHAPPESAIRAADAVFAAIPELHADEIPDIMGLTSVPSLRMLAGGSRARALWCSGEVEAGRQGFRQLLTVPDLYAPWRIHCLGALALLEAWAGNLRRASHLSAEAVGASNRARLDPYHPAVADALHAGAHVLRERGEHRRAQDLLDRTSLVVERLQRPMAAAIHTVERASLHLADGRPEAALAAIERQRRAYGVTMAPIVERRLVAVEARSFLAMADPDGARSVLDRASGPRPPEVAAMAVQAALATSDVEAARAELERWPDQVVEPTARMERALWTSIVELEAGHRRSAVHRAWPVVEAARAEGHVRLFLDAGPPGERLVRALHSDRATPYTSRLVRAASLRRRDTGRARSVLSERELEIVRYLPTSQSNADIAAALYVSLNTLKTHLRTIYRKLGVTGRAEAIQRAEELGVA